MKKYLTTPLYYVNGRPHIGHSFTNILVDTFKRYFTLFGYDTKMLTGVDEHGQKVYDVAREQNLTPKEYCDTLIPYFTDMWESQKIEYDIFFRTTNKKHIDKVQTILTNLYEKGDIYKDFYEGNYCKHCETFYTEKDLVDGKCPECNRETIIIKEENYFFNMEKYANKLEEYILNNKDFIKPTSRRNEVLGILKKGLRPLCISRKKEKLAWGIEIPFDKDFVTYVWFDALTNYIDGIGYLENQEQFDAYWPNVAHFIGKDILLHHCIYWPTMLLAMGLNLPRNIIIHGWWLGEGGAKMSKSLGNAVDPNLLVEKYGLDPFRFFMLRNMSLGQDGIFDMKNFIKRNNNELANDFGNLINRATHLISKNFDAKIPENSDKTEFCDPFIEQFKDSLAILKPLCENFEINKLLDEIMKLIRSTNKYLENTAPWKLLKTDKKKCGTVLYNSLEAVRLTSILLSPVIPTKFEEIKKLFPNGLPSGLEFGKLISGEPVLAATALFPKFELETVDEIKPKKVKENDNLITIDDFGKVEIRTGKIIKAEKVKDSDRLLYTTVDFGPFGKRKIIAGIAKYYEPADIQDKIVLAATNLKPATIRGLDSEGMLLTIKIGKKIQLLVQNDNLPIGKKLI